MKKIDLKNGWAVNFGIIALVMIALFLLYSMSGCKLTENQIKRFQNEYCPEKDSTSTVITNTIVSEPVWYMDSTYFNLWLGCNENNEVYIKKSETYQGKYTTLQSKLDSLSVLHVKTKTIIHDTVYIPVSDTIFWRFKTRKIITNELNKSQAFYYRFGKWSFWILIVAVVIALVYTFFKFKSKILGFFKPK